MRLKRKPFWQNPTVPQSSLDYNCICEALFSIGILGTSFGSNTYSHYFQSSVRCTIVKKAVRRTQPCRRKLQRGQTQVRLRWEPHFVSTMRKLQGSAGMAAHRQRPAAAEDWLDLNYEVETADHEDHTFYGLMFDLSVTPRTCSVRGSAVANLRRCAMWREKTIGKARIGNVPSHGLRQQTGRLPTLADESCATILLLRR